MYNSYIPYSLSRDTSILVIYMKKLRVQLINNRIESKGAFLSTCVWRNYSKMTVRVSIMMFLLLSFPEIGSIHWNREGVTVETPTIKTKRSFCKNKMEILKSVRGFFYFRRFGSKDRYFSVISLKFLSYFSFFFNHRGYRET